MHIRPSAETAARRGPASLSLPGIASREGLPGAGTPVQPAMPASSSLLPAPRTSWLLPVSPDLLNRGVGTQEKAGASQAWLVLMLALKLVSELAQSRGVSSKM